MTCIALGPPRLSLRRCETGLPVTEDPYRRRALLAEDVEEGIEEDAEEDADEDAPHNSRQLQRWRNSKKWQRVKKWQRTPEGEVPK